MKRHTASALFAILLLATALRFFHVADIPLRADEAANLNLALQTPNDIIRPLATSDPHLPTFFLLLHSWLALAGTSELALRFPTLFASILLVPLVYRLGRRMFPPPRVAWLAAFFVALSPALIWDAQDAYMYALLAAASLGSFIALLAACEPRASWRNWALYVFLSALALYVHYLAALVLLAEGSVWLGWTATRQIGRRASVAYVVAQFAIAALFIPWLYLSLPLLTSFQTNFFQPVGVGEFFFRAFTAFSVGRIDARLMTPLIDPVSGSLWVILFAVVFAVGLFAPSRAMKDANERTMLAPQWVLALYIFVPLLAYLIFTLVRFPLFDERYVYFLIPPFLLLLARGLVVLAQRPARRWLAFTVASLLTLASMQTLFNYWYVPAFAKSPDWRAWTQTLDAHAQAGDVLIQNYPDPALLYYLQARVPRVLLPRTNPASSANVAADMDRLAARYTRLWFQPVPGGEWDTEGLVAAWLERHARFVQEYGFRGVRLALYLPFHTALAQATPRAARFANQMQLRGFDFTQAQNLRPGADVQIALYWQANQNLARDATVFVHLYAPNGKLVAQQDSQPVHGAYPTHEWRAGETVVDVHTLSVPENLTAGEYVIAVGIYDSQTEARVEIVSSSAELLSDQRIILSAVEIK